MNSQQGQTVIESVIALPISILGISGFFVLVWSLTVSILAHHDLYEMLICFETYPTPQDCRQKTQTQIQSLLMFGRLENLTYQKEISVSRGIASIQLPLHLKVQMKESLRLPLHD